MAFPADVQVQVATPAPVMVATYNKKGGLLHVQPGSELANNFADFEANKDKPAPSKFTQIKIGLLGSFVGLKAKQRAMHEVSPLRSFLALFVILAASLGSLAVLVLVYTGQSCANMGGFTAYVGNLHDLSGGLRAHDLKQFLGVNEGATQWDYCQVYGTEIKTYKKGEHNWEHAYDRLQLGEAGDNGMSEDGELRNGNCIIVCGEGDAGDEGQCEAQFNEEKGFKTEKITIKNKKDEDRPGLAIDFWDKNGACKKGNEDEHAKTTQWWKDEGFKKYGDGKNPGGFRICNGLIYGDRNRCDSSLVATQVMALWPTICAFAIFFSSVIFLGASMGKDVAEELFLDPTEKLNRKVDLLYHALTKPADAQADISGQVKGNAASSAKELVSGILG